MDFTWHYDSPIGGMTMASDGEALVGLWFDGQKYDADVLDAEHREKMLPVFEKTCLWLDIYFSGKEPDFTPELKIRGTAFRKRVCEIMLGIPYGSTMTYGDIVAILAGETGMEKMSAQAVGGAVGHNSISLIIPCHRVVGSKGKLTGYAGGLDRKIWLLEKEMSTIDGISIRRAKNEDIPALMEIFAKARRYMAETGNPNQWAENYPGEKLLREDIAHGDSYVCVKDGRTVATFVLRGGEDPTYREIFGGQWLNDGPYATIHRIASSGEAKGVLHLAMCFARKRYRNIRIDTHRDNSVMQRAIAKEGFTYCGIIHCWNGEERLAYQYEFVEKD